MAQDKLNAGLFNVTQTKETEVVRKLFAYGANLSVLSTLETQL